MPPSVSSSPDDDRLRLLALRDAYRSARRWRDLLAETDRQALLAGIARVALAVGRDLTRDRDVSDLDIGVANDATRDICPRERLAFLEAAWPRVASALRQIEAAPFVRLEAQTRLAPIERARRITPCAVLEAVRMGDFVPAASSVSPLAVRLHGRLPRRIREQTLTPNGDTPPNRAVKTILVQWARDLQTIADLAHVVGDANAARRAEALRARVRARLRGDLWRNLAPLPTVTPLAPSLRTSGPYRLLHDTYRRYRRGFVFDWNNPVFSLPAKETWRLYEYWCFFAVADVLRSLGFRVSGADDFVVSRGGLQWALASGRASRLVFSGAGGKRVTLTYNRPFERADGEAGRNGSPKRGDAFYSRSHALRPDITLQITGKVNGLPALWVFDAKFKTYAENGWETDDIRQMHSYRDAIRQTGQDDAVVRGAWLLYAGRATSVNRAVIAFPQVTPARPWGNGDVGALCLRPDDDNRRKTLTALVADALAEIV